MAKIKLGQGLVAARGKVGGMVFSNNKAGAFMSSTGSRPSTPKPQSVPMHGTWGQWSNYEWSHNLSNGDRLAWNNYAAAHPYSNVWGNTAYLSGHGWFNKVNIYRYMIGLATQVATPSGSPPLGAQNITGSCDTGSMTYNISVTTYSGQPNVFCFYWSGKSVSAGKSVPGHTLHNISGGYVTGGGATTTTNLWLAYATYFKSVEPIVSKKLFFGVILFDPNTGLNSEVLRSSDCIIT